MGGVTCLCLLGLKSEVLVGPFHSLDDLPFQACLVWPRFPIWERHGLGEWKVRNIDDGLACRVNEAVSSSDTYIPDAVPELSNLLRAFKEVFPADELALWIADFLSAYRQSPACPREAYLRVIVTWDPSASRRVFAYHRAQPFGARPAPRCRGALVAHVRERLRGFRPEPSRFR